MGWARRCSTTRKAGAVTAARTRLATTAGLDQPLGRGLDEPVGQAGQEQRRPARAPTLSTRPALVGSRVSGTWRAVMASDRRRHREVDVEDPAPGPDGEEVAADERAGRRRDAAQPRPGADGAGAVLGAERGLQDGEAGRGEERPADALDHPGRDEQPGARGHAAAGRRDGEPDDPDGEDALAAVAVAEGSPEEEEGGQRERVAGDDPLQRADAAVELAADGGERDADDGRIEKGDAGAEDGGGDHPAPAAARERRAGRRPRPTRAPLRRCPCRRSLGAEVHRDPRPRRPA